MKTCRGCGTSYRDDETFCPNCGMKAEEPVSAGWDPYQPAQRASAPAAANYSLKWHRFLMVVMKAMSHSSRVFMARLTE